MCIMSSTGKKNAIIKTLTWFETLIMYSLLLTQTHKYHWNNEQQQQQRIFLCYAAMLSAVYFSRTLLSYRNLQKNKILESECLSHTYELTDLYWIGMRVVICVCGCLSLCLCAVYVCYCLTTFATFAFIFLSDEMIRYSFVMAQIRNRPKENSICYFAYNQPLEDRDRNSTVW